MRKLLCVVAMLATPLTAAALQLVSVTTARQVSENSQPLDSTETFSASDSEINAVARFDDVRRTSTVTGTWVSIDAIETPNYEIASKSLTLDPGANLAHFALSRPNNGWPTGNYELVLAVDGIVYTRVPFAISENAPPPNTAHSQPPTSAPGGQAASPTIVGTWQCQMKAFGMTVGQTAMSFDGVGRAIIDGSDYDYEVVSSSRLRVQDTFGKHNYKYKLEGNDLEIRYAGTRFVCARAASRLASAPGMGPQSGGPQSGGGNSWMLQGTFCGYSGTSSTNTNYSREDFVTFDGRGNWSMDSATSINTGVDSYIGERGGPGGTYQISGNRILYQTHMGEQGVAEVYMQQSNGEITEIKIDGQLYSPELCDY